jgi:hypothetical protein
MASDAFFPDMSEFCVMLLDIKAAVMFIALRPMLSSSLNQILRAVSQTQIFHPDVYDLQLYNLQTISKVSFSFQL